MLADVGEDALKFKGVYLDANGTGMYARSACLARSKKTDIATTSGYHVNATLHMRLSAFLLDAVKAEGKH